MPSVLKTQFFPLRTSRPVNNIYVYTCTCITLLFNLERFYALLTVLILSVRRYMFGLSGVPAFVQGIGMYFLPYSPRWLILKGHDQKVGGQVIDFPFHCLSWSSTAPSQCSVMTSCNQHWH